MLKFKNNKIYNFVAQKVNDKSYKWKTFREKIAFHECGWWNLDGKKKEVTEKENMKNKWKIVKKRNVYE